MYLKKSNFFFPLVFLILALFHTSCKSEVSESKISKKEKETNLSFEERAKRAVEAELKINASEKYNIQIHKAKIDRDTLEDAIILVNRKQWAFERAKKNDNYDFLKRIGFTGPYNNVFVYLGKYDKFISTPNVGSSAEYPLELDFEVITTPSQKDFYVDYRIKNSVHRNYYTVRNDRVFLTFNCPVYDSIGEPNPEVYAIQHRDSPVRLAKDIALYYGEIPGYNPSEIENINNYTPDQIVSTDKLFVFFIFDEKTMSYVTPMTNEMENKE
ncbi:MAG: hypothetical protein COA32_10730 [Fluviicola sp.]|nr:MAG: hypothetical protein COA32_10730 [Fluviicola sp.]